MSIESMNSQPEHEMTQEEAGVLYQTLPEGMKTGHYGFAPTGEVFHQQQEAGPNALPFVVVNFSDGRKIALHLSLRGGKSAEEQVQDIMTASADAHNVAHVELVWQVV